MVVRQILSDVTDLCDHLMSFKSGRKINFSSISKLFIFLLTKPTIFYLNILDYPIRNMFSPDLLANSTSFSLEQLSRLNPCSAIADSFYQILEESY